MIALVEQFKLNNRFVIRYAILSRQLGEKLSVPFFTKVRFC